MGFTRLTPSKPTIAAISGFCLAGGLELALWCDLRIATEGSTLGYPERRWGVPLIDGGTQRLPRIVGLGRALDLILTGRMIDAPEALAMGLLTEVVPTGRAPRARAGARRGARALPAADDARRSPRGDRGPGDDARGGARAGGAGRARGVRGRRAAAPRASPPARAAAAPAPEPSAARTQLSATYMLAVYLWRWPISSQERPASSDAASIERLLEQRQGKVYVLVRESSTGRLDDLIERWSGRGGSRRGEARPAGRRRPAQAAAGARERAGRRAARARSTTSSTSPPSTT